MTQQAIAATRVVAADVELGQYRDAFDFPRYIQVHIPATDEIRTYDLAAVSPDQIIAALEHGLSQKLGDAAAGKTGEKAVEAVTKREATLWAATRQSAKTDPVTAEVYKIVCDILRRPKAEGGQGLKTKELPTMKEFPAFLAKQDQAAVAQIRAVAEANVAAAAKAKAGLTL